MSLELLKESVAVPLRGDAATERLLIGGALVLVTPLVVPAVMLNGYLLRVLLAGVRGEETLPDIHNWKQLANDGIGATAVIAAFAIPAILLIGALAGAIDVLGVSVFAGLNLPPHLVLILPFVFVPLVGFPVGAVVIGILAGIQIVSGVVISTPLVLLLSLVLVPLFSYPIPAALVGLGMGGSIGAAFDLGRFRKILLSREYLTGVIGGWLLVVAGAIIGGGLSVILVGFVLVFASQVGAVFLYGRAYRQAADSLPG